MSEKNRQLGYQITIAILVVIILILVISNQIRHQKQILHQVADTALSTISDTVFTERIINDTVYLTQVRTRTKISYVDTTPLVLSSRRSFIYIRDTFNIDDRTYYITETDDTVKVFYFDYTYYIFKYHLKDSLVAIDSVLGCDLYTHCLCDERERIVIFHTCEGESRMIINMLNKQKDKKN